jgi:hypothetical protein
VIDVRLDHDYEYGTSIVDHPDATWGIVVKATPEEVAEWKQSIEAYDRVQAVMRKRWSDALEAELASRPPEPPPDPRDGTSTTTITWADVLCEDDEWTRRVGDELAKACILYGIKRIDEAWGITKPEGQP